MPPHRAPLPRQNGRGQRSELVHNPHFKTKRKPHIIPKGNWKMPRGGPRGNWWRRPCACILVALEEKCFSSVILNKSKSDLAPTAKARNKPAYFDTPHLPPEARRTGGNGQQHFITSCFLDRSKNSLATHDDQDFSTTDNSRDGNEDTALRPAEGRRKGA